MKSGSRLEQLLARGEFAVTAEMGPPMSADAGVIAKKAELLRRDPREKERKKYGLRSARKREQYSKR